MEEVALQRLITLKKLLTCLKREFLFLVSLQSVPSKQAEVAGKRKKLTTSSTALSHVLESMQQTSLTKKAFCREHRTEPQTSRVFCHLPMFQRLELLLFSPIHLHLWFMFHVKIQQSP